MYNLTVAGAHTFFVGDGQWLVHNACSGKLDKALGGVVSDGKQAHHLIPGELEGDALIQRAIGAGWDIDGASNGLLLPGNAALSQTLGLPLHNTSHAAYTTMIQGQLNALRGTAGNMTDAQLIGAINQIAANAKTYLQNLGGGVRVPR